MTARWAERMSRRSAFVFAACLLSGMIGGAAIGLPRDVVAGRILPTAKVTAPLVLAQNPGTPFSLPEMAEPPISPINPGTLPGSTAAIGGSATGTNPVTGLACNGSGSLAVSGAGGLPGTATPPPGLNETLDQIPVGAPPVTSVFGSQSNLGPC
jgi:hypothetical protein